MSAPRTALRPGIGDRHSARMIRYVQPDGS